MNTQQLQCIINCDSLMKNRVLGVFPFDKIPDKYDHRPLGLIINIDNSEQAGRHWIAVYFDSHGLGELFDSYGNSPEYFGLKSSLNYNDVRLQSPFSDVCGQYCIFFLLHRCRGITMKEIVERFSNNVNKNDSFVRQYVHNVFPYCFQHEGFQTCYPEK